MYHGNPDLWKDLLTTGLKEDGWPWDWTTLGTRKAPDQVLHAHVIGKSDGVWAAQSLVTSLPSLFPSVRVEFCQTDGFRFQSGSELLKISGVAHELLALERPFLNLAAYVSGIATQTARYVDAVSSVCPKNPPRVTLTRKTLPGYRDIAIQGVRVGGGYPHRVSLSGGVLIKENHIAAAGGIAPAISGVRAIAPHGLKIEVEVRSLDELKQAIQAEADGVLLDNFSPDEVKLALHELQGKAPRPWVEISGGIHESTIRSYAMDGVQVISVGALTHSSKSVDLSFLVDG
jgi:nicotinate-nucleotide pyrophosphorylase (carboxylating)